MWQTQMEEAQKGKRRQVVVAMKGHPGTRKSTLARAVAGNLRCPVLDKDDLYSASSSIFNHLDSSTADDLANDFSYQSLWNLISTQLRLGLSIVLDSPLSRRSRLDRLLHLAADDGQGATVVVVECRSGDEEEWRRRLEWRGAQVGSRWNQAATWEDMKRMVDRYDGCYEYDAGDVPKLVVDTTAPVAAEDLVSSVMAFIRSHCNLS